MKKILINSVSLITLCLIANTAWGMQQDSDDETENPKTRYSVGKDWDDRKSVASNAFSVRNPQSSGKKKSTKEELSYDEQDEWERGTVRTDLDDVEVSGQELADIKDLKKHFFMGNLEITPQNYQVLTQHTSFYATAFKMFDEGVLVKGWKASLGFEPLTDLLYAFQNLKAFKVSINWDKEEDVSETIARAIQFYKNLTELEISNCKLSDEVMTVIMKSVKDPKKLSILNVTDNKLSKDTLTNLKKHFPNLASFKTDINLETETNSPSPIKGISDMPSLKTLSIQEKEEMLEKTSPIISTHQALSKEEPSLNYPQQQNSQQFIPQTYPDSINMPSTQSSFGNSIYSMQGPYDSSENNSLVPNQTPMQEFTISPEEQGLDIKLLKKAKAGDDYSQCNIGYMYHVGQGVTQNYSEALKWYLKAAHQNNVYAQYNIGLMCEFGLGGKADKKIALEWYQQAANQGHEDAKKKVQDLKNAFLSTQAILNPFDNSRNNSLPAQKTEILTKIPNASGIVNRPVVSDIVIPEIARGYEEIYRIFVMGKLIYKPDSKSDKGRIELPIRALANPLEGTFDLSQCGDSGKYFSISIGYRKGKKAENAKKVEVWIAPRFLIEKNRAGSASHFQPIMSGWSASSAPVGIFWTWGGWDDLAYYDHITTSSIESLSDNNLYQNWGDSTTTAGSPLPLYGLWLGVIGGRERGKLFHISFVN